MARATHTAIVAVCYFLIPLALCVGLVVTGTFVIGYLLTTNLLIALVVLCGIFVGLILIMFRKYRINALMLICSILLIAGYYWYFVGQDRRRLLYVAEIRVTPHFDKKCAPPNGILLNGDTLRLCSVHEFSSWVDLIFKIDGPYPAERLIADLTSRSVTPAVGNELTKLGQYSFVFGLPNTVTDQHLVADYYLLRFKM